MSRIVSIWDHRTESWRLMAARRRMLHEEALGRHVEWVERDALRRRAMLRMAMLCLALVVGIVTLMVTL